MLVHLDGMDKTGYLRLINFSSSVKILCFFPPFISNCFDVNLPLIRQICRQSKQLLDLMCNRVVVNLNHFNPGLFNRVEGLTNIKVIKKVNM